MCSIVDMFVSELILCINNIIDYVEEKYPRQEQCEMLPVKQQN